MKNQDTVYTGDMVNLLHSGQLIFACPLCQKEFEFQRVYSPFTLVVDHNKHAGKDNG